MQKNFICLVCPQSCELVADGSEIAGNQCMRGIEFAQQEMTNPQRVLTTTVKLTTRELLPVKSDGTVKKQELTELVRQLRAIVLTPPVKLGEVVVRSVGENKVDIVAADNVL